MNGGRASHRAELRQLVAVLGRHVAQQVALLLGTVRTVLAAEPRLLAALHAPVSTETLPVLVHPAALVARKSASSPFDTSSCNIRYTYLCDTTLIISKIVSHIFLYTRTTILVVIFNTFSTT